LRLLEQAPPDHPYELVLMDWKMPGLDGIETTRRIRGLPDLPVPPKIILVTAYAHDEAMEASQDTDLDGLLIKPVSPSTMLNTIMQAFGKVEAQKMIKPQQDREADMARPIRGAKILLVEDNEINQQVAKEILEGAGLIVTIANDGREGVDAVRAGNYELVLMDIQMPVMDGYQATQEIRKNPSYADLPIIAMTASAMTQDKENAAASGMDDHVSKPIDTGELFSTLLKWIEPGERELPELSATSVPVVQLAEEDDIPDLPGIDVEGGLKRVGGNRKLYRTLLLKFYEDYPKATAEIETALQDGDRELAQRLAHTVKGVAGNIGASDMQSAAEKVEQAVKQSEEDLAGLLSDFQQALSAVLDSLAGLSPPEEQVVSAAAGEETDPVVLTASLEELAGHLSKRKPKPCKAAMEDVRKLAWPESFASEVDDLSKLVGKYKFKDAAALVKSLIEKLGDLSVEVGETGK
jgi:CheY-like chemotaxis protein